MLMSKKSHLNFVFRAIHGSRVSHQLGSSVFPSIPVQQFIALPQQCHCKPCSTTTFDTTKTIGERIAVDDETASTADSIVDSTLAALLLKSRLKNTSLPEPIERDGLRWEQALRAEQASGDNFWLDFGLKCIRRTTSLGQIILTFSKENLSSQQTILLEKVFRTETMVKMKYSARPSASVTGCIKDQKQDEFTVQTRDGLQTSSWEGKSFKLGKLRSFNDLTFLTEREKLWPRLAGYKAMLYAYKYKQMHGGGGDAEPKWAAKVEQQHFNPSQMAALVAALNPQRPIVAVHGPVGTGKTMLLTNYLHILMTQKPKHYRVAVVVPSVRSMYSLIQKYVELAKEETAHFICYRQFRPQVADSIATTNPSIRQLLELTSFREMPTDFMSKKTVDCMATVERLRNDMYESRVLESKMFDLRIVGSRNEQTYHSYRAKAKQFREQDEMEFIRTKRIVFLSQYGKTFKKLALLGVHFDEVVFHDAGPMCEYDAWRAILSLSSRVRLFGDYCDLAKLLLTETSYQLEWDKPLMKTLDEKFGPEVNFHLDRQYTTNPALQVWANRMFYGERAVKPANETVEKTMNLDSLLGSKKASTAAEDNNTNLGQQQQRSQLLLTDPLLFVDIAQLEGQWQEWMFKTETAVSTSRSAAQFHTLQNWGSALLTAHHIHGLLERGLPAERLAARLGSVSQQFLLTQIFAALYSKQMTTDTLSKMHMTKTWPLQGQRVDVLIKTPIDPDFEFPERARRHLLSYLNFVLSRPQRQFVLIGHRRWLEEDRAPGYRQLLDCFLSHGRVVGPNEMLPLGSGEFEEIVAKTEEQIRLREKVNRTGTEGEIDEEEERKLRRKLIKEVNHF